MSEALSNGPTLLHPLFVWFPEKSEFVAKAMEMQRSGTLRASKPLDEQDLEIIWAIENIYARREKVDE